MITNRKASRGFSIVETIVALGILTFSLYGIYDQFLEARKQSAERLTVIQARLLAHQEMECLRACPYDSLKAGVKLGAKQFPGHLRFLYQPSLTTRPDGVIEIEVRVGWDTPTQAGFDEGNSVTAKGYKVP